MCMVIHVSTANVSINEIVNVLICHRYRITNTISRRILRAKIPNSYFSVICKPHDTMPGVICAPMWLHFLTKEGRETLQRGRCSAC